MSLKDLIRALFKLSGGQAMPSANYIDLPLNSPHDTLKDYVAPCDGYLAVLTNDTNGWAECRNDDVTFIYSRSNGDFPSAYMPVSKGQNVKYRLSQASSGYHYARFIKLMGGVKRLLSQALLLVRGGGLCLRHFSNHCSRFLLKKQRARGLSTKPVQRQFQVIKLLSFQTVISARSWHLLTGGFQCHRVVLKTIGLEHWCHSRMTAVAHCYQQLRLAELVGSDYRYRLEKERISLFNTRTAHRLISDSPSVLAVANNIATEVCHG